jgi:hypothetical protein
MGLSPILILFRSGIVNGAALYARSGGLFDERREIVAGESRGCEMLEDVFLNAEQGLLR